MARKARVESSSGIYLIMLQAAEQQTLFREDADREKFVRLLRDCKEKCGFELYAYSLTREAALLLLRKGTEPLSAIFKRLGSAYVYWYNVKYSRRGGLFRDRFRSLPAETDHDLKRMMRYVHYQPVREGLSRDLRYAYSSWQEYLGMEDDGLTDTELPFRKIGREELLDYHETDGKEVFPTASARGTGPITEEAAADILRQLSRASDPEEYLQLPKQTQMDCVIKAHHHGASIRQLSRLTGLSKATVEKWLKDAPPEKESGDKTPLFPFPFFPFFMSSGESKK